MRGILRKPGGSFLLVSFFAAALLSIVYCSCIVPGGRDRFVGYCAGGVILSTFGMFFFSQKISERSA